MTLNCLGVTYVVYNVLTSEVLRRLVFKDSATSFFYMHEEQAHRVRQEQLQMLLQRCNLLVSDR